MNLAGIKVTYSDNNLKYLLSEVDILCHAYENSKPQRSQPFVVLKIKVVAVKQGS